MRYMLNVEVKLLEIEDDEIEPVGDNTTTMQAGDDPLKALQSIGTTALKLMKPGPIMALPFSPPAGIDYRRSVAVNVQGFSNAAEILSKYEALTREIQLHQV